MKHAILKSVVLSLSLLAIPASAETPDAFITAKTKLSLWTTANVKSTAVNVDTNEGVVTLYGKVATADQKSLAEKTAMQIDGVKSVRNLLQVVPESQVKEVAKNDKDLKDQANKALKAESMLKESDISVKSVDKGVALLTGKAATVSDLLRAISTVDRQPGIQRVVNEVKGPEGFAYEERVWHSNQPPKTKMSSTASDMRISTGVKLKLLTTPSVPSMEINVDTTDGIVTLFGIVPTEDVKRAAATEAASVSGVTKVENQLEVVPSSERKVVDAKDEDITRDVTLAFKDRTELKDVTANVKNGTVRLTGTVKSGWAELTAVRLARSVNGVRMVEDQLKIDDKAPTKTSQRE